jgi:uncharacterized protein (TIGR00661 family)
LIIFLPEDSPLKRYLKHETCSLKNLSLQKKILIAPLDWGLGHATRCIPIINELLNHDCEVQIATSGKALVLLKGEYPLLRFHEIVSYDIHYSRTLALSLSLLFQVTKIMKCISEEHQQIERIVNENKIDFIVSDSRFGCWSDRVPSVFVTHQLNILMPAALTWIGSILNYWNHRQIRKFDRCWVPDGLYDRITGKLTESKGLTIAYIGMLSRFEKIKSAKKKYDILVLISGPEPERTLMERTLLKKIANAGVKVMLVRGIPEATTSGAEVSENMFQINHLNAKLLNRVIEESEIIISRSGYSTIMDLAKLNKKAIFIPTPGQTEQLYLAKQLRRRKIAYTTSLSGLDLDKAVKLSSNYSGFNGFHNGSLLKQAVTELLA